jgi:DNA-binding SARP family transcriptional activator
LTGVALTAGDVSIHLFGRAHVIGLPDEASVGTGVLQMMALLALAHDHRLPRSHLAARMWPDVPRQRAKRRLSTVLWRARRQLCEPLDREVVAADRGGSIALQLSKEVTIDLVEFDRMSRRVGTADLARLTTKDIALARQLVAESANELLENNGDEWIHDARTAIEARRSLVAMRLARWHLRHQPLQTAIGDVETLHQLVPLSEEVASLLDAARRRLDSPAQRSRELQLSPVVNNARAVQAAAAALRALDGLRADLSRIDERLRDLERHLREAAAPPTSPVAPKNPL